MPELPEVETIKRQLGQKLLGLKVSDIKIRKPRMFKGNPKDAIGAKIAGVERRGKIIIINLSNEKTLLVHLKLTGQLVYHKDGEEFKGDFPIPFAGGTTLPGKTTHIIFDFEDGSRLFFNDLRRFGWIKVIQKSNIKNQKEVSELGVEPFDKEFTSKYLQEIFSKTKKPIKLVLMDQTKIAGIGNIYANEALFEAGIDPRREAKKLSNLEIEKLREAITQVLKEGLKYGGSSGADEAYIKPNGRKGAYQEHFKVYQREGRPCSKCKTPIERVQLGGRGTFFCPKCQR